MEQQCILPGFTLLHTCIKQYEGLHGNTGNWFDISKYFKKYHIGIKLSFLQVEDIFFGKEDVPVNTSKLFRTDVL